MKVLFLTLIGFDSFQERNIYTDLLREFIKNGHFVYAISPAENHQNIQTHLIKEKNGEILRLHIGDTQKTNIFRKGISTVMIELQFKAAIKKYFYDVKFDLVIYSTPPITLVSAIDYVKRRDNAKTYLLLKDIFPQNALDIGILSKSGVKGIIYKLFRNKEKKLYKISDRIGCMSQANVDYVLMHNPEINSKIVEICPNSIDIIDKRVNEEIRNRIRIKYGIPINKKVFVYGGNLGRPQGIPFLIEAIRMCKDVSDAFFLIVGDGTEYCALEKYLNESKQTNLKLLKMLPKEDYDDVVAACDVGMIFLDYRFSIPNFPSRLLSYLQAAIPVLAATDIVTDIGRIIENNHFGKWCKSNNANDFLNSVETLIDADRNKMGNQGWSYLKDNYSTEKAYGIIIKIFS